MNPVPRLLVLALAVAPLGAFASPGTHPRLLTDAPTAVGSSPLLSLVPLALNDTAAPAAGGATAMPAPVATVRETTLFGLPRNIGPVDRILRGVAFAALAGVGTYGLVSKNIGTAGSAVMIGVSVIPLVTALTGYCPIYHAFGIQDTF